ncbi:MAG: cytochrome c biogenesis heme-transporting ATPase CcmA [Rubrivivax sp.]|nr:cytochrome c biogenesis heme-transporting ATPase CcmA [Rubrivivax sp.]
MADGTLPLLRAAGLEGQRGERTLFRGLELTLAPGEIVWLRGRNGRGKTTLLRLLAGLATPAAGDIAIDGQAARGSAWRAGMSYIAHANALKDDLSATEALSFLAGLAGRTPSSTELKQALTRLGVAERARAPVRTLSQGQRRRVALARLALPQAPRLWLLDEPFDALDDIGIGTLNGLLAEHSARGGAALLTSHQALSLSQPQPREFSLDPFAVGH